MRPSRLAVFLLCLTACFFGSSSYGKMGPAPIAAYKNYVGAYHYMDDAEDTVWEIAGIEFYGLQWVDDPWPVVAIAVERSYLFIDLGTIQPSQRFFRHLETELTEGGSILWFVFEGDFPPIRAFVQIKGPYAPKPNEKLGPRTMQMVNQYLVCVPSHTAVDCSNFTN